MRRFVGEISNLWSKALNFSSVRVAQDTILSRLALVIQKLFFRDIKSEPKEIWRKRAQTQGQLRTFEICRDGKRIVGYILEPPPKCLDESATHSASRLVVFSHPISRKGKYFFSESDRAKTYLRRGYTVLAFDYNGFSESDAIDLFYWRDAVAVIDYAKKHFAGYDFTLHGTSFGAFHIIRALAHLPSNANVVLENVNKSLLSYWKKWPKTGILVRVLEAMRLRAIRDMDVQSVVRDFDRQDLHIQFIACEQDQMTTLAEMQDLYDQLASQNKSFTVFKGAGHLAAPHQDPGLYESALFARG